ncbi:hypothetical protein [Paraburkholderia saeva]|uniref:hypothetical protein n=1 Tax=Paraburkholderia saeva TaxID=2777537 RepID=UPI001D41E65F|nr:hypothetical protein [Paraburkholderia saeva]CAG4887955.1 hypothetical protein R52603_00545 [Paraburkholderia saeva]
MPDETQDRKVSKPVKVYCKLPNGIQYILPDGRRVRLVGMYGDERSALQVSGLQGRDAVFGFGVTMVDADDWAQIVKDHGKSAAHANELIFAAKDDKSGASQAKNNETEKTGLEAYDPQAHPEDKTGDGTKDGRQEEQTA